MAKPASSSDYPGLLVAIKQRIRDAQYAALRAVNRELVALYWDIGAAIARRQEGTSWGRSIVESLSRDLQKAFPDTRGLSPLNLWLMRNLYLAYAQDLKLSPVVKEIGWTHNVIILESCKARDEREFYLHMTHRHGWSKNVLTHQIENKTYEKTLSSQNNFAAALPEPMQQEAQLSIKDEYTFDFLELGDEHSERQLELALLSRVEPFLREMGGVFSLIGSQFRLEVSGKEYFIDLLLFHRHLRALVAVELKVGEFLPEHVGKMQFYLAVLDENPSIGILLCKSKDKITVDYALKESKKPIGVAAYRLHRTLPEELRTQLPGPEQLRQLLDPLEPRA